MSEVGTNIVKGCYVRSTKTIDMRDYTAIAPPPTSLFCFFFIKIPLCFNNNIIILTDFLKFFK